MDQPFIVVKEALLNVCGQKNGLRRSGHVCGGICWFCQFCQVVPRRRINSNLILLRHSILVWHTTPTLFLILFPTHNSNSEDVQIRAWVGFRAVWNFYLKIDPFWYCQDFPNGSIFSLLVLSYFLLYTRVEQDCQVKCNIYPLCRNQIVIKPRKAAKTMYYNTPPGP